MTDSNNANGPAAGHLPNLGSQILAAAPAQVGYILNCAAVVVEGATVTRFVTGATAMLALGVILGSFGIGLFCWLIFTLAVYALPFFVALITVMTAFHSGAGMPGALVTGIIVGTLTVSAGQIAFACVRPTHLRVAIATAFAIPAAIAGHHVIFGLSQIGVPSLFWREAFAWAGAIVIGCTAWARMTCSPNPFHSGWAGQLRITQGPFSHPQRARAEPPRLIVERR